MCGAESEHVDLSFLPPPICVQRARNLHVDTPGAHIRKGTRRKGAIWLAGLVSIQGGAAHGACTWGGGGGGGVGAQVVYGAGYLLWRLLGAS